MIYFNLFDGYDSWCHQVKSRLEGYHQGVQLSVEGQVSAWINVWPVYVLESFKFLSICQSLDLYVTSISLPTFMSLYFLVLTFPLTWHLHSIPLTPFPLSSFPSPRRMRWTLETFVRCSKDGSRGTEKRFLPLRRSSRGMENHKLFDI